MTNAHNAHGRAWWKECSVYQIYPASFRDSNGSGIGDLKGIISQLDYLENLGIDIVWLSPIFKSPQIDMGYDISDYKTIDPQYGDVRDVDVLRDMLHKRGMKLVLDLVVNHTSDEHDWFRESRKSKDNPYRDWYVWRPPKYDANGTRHPPNNWDSHFQGSAWEYDATTDEYYLHLFCKEQPDLNWENEAVRTAVHHIMRFWLDKGVDGFRLDVINFISKDQRFMDSKQSILKGHEFYACGPRCHEFLKEVGSILQDYDAFSVGEMPCVHDREELVKAVAADRGELNMIFHFELMDLDYGAEGKFSRRNWTLLELKTIVNKWQTFMIENEGWNALYLENHDQPRSVSRFGLDDPENRGASAKLLAMFMGFQSGTPFIYQGQELGMTNVPIEWSMEEYKDIDCLNHWSILKESVDQEKKDMVISEYQKKSRDNARTPMQWTAEVRGGFTYGKSPWMRVNDNYEHINAAAQTSDPSSPFQCWKIVLQKRKEHKEVFVYGDFSLVDEANSKIFAYKRKSADGTEALIAAKFSEEHITWRHQETAREVILSSNKKTIDDVKGGYVCFRPYEAIALLL